MGKTQRYQAAVDWMGRENRQPLLTIGNLSEKVNGIMVSRAGIRAS